MNQKQIFHEIDSHLLQDIKPSLYLTGLFESEGFEAGYPFDMLAALKQTKQSPEHHPEGSVWNHTMLVVDFAAKYKDESADKRVFMWAALLHDIGKAETTKTRNGKITSYDHDRAGEKMAVDFLREFTDDEAFIGKVSALVRYHMHLLFVTKDLPFAQTTKMKRDTDLKEVALLGLCDRLGRGGAVSFLDEMENVNLFLGKCGADYKIEV